MPTVRFYKLIKPPKQIRIDGFITVFVTHASEFLEPVKVIKWGAWRNLLWFTLATTVIIVVIIIFVILITSTPAFFLRAAFATAALAVFFSGFLTRIILSLPKSFLLFPFSFAATTFPA